MILLFDELGACYYANEPNEVIKDLVNEGHLTVIELNQSVNPDNMTVRWLYDIADNRDDETGKVTKWEDSFAENYEYFEEDPFIDDPELDSLEDEIMN